MKELTIAEIKAIQLNILNEVDQFCKDNNIKYSLTFGTLLGAVRHKGYIPWDDDIDIMMPRPDYMKFIKSFNNLNDKFKVKSIYNDGNYPYPFAKVEDTKTKLVEFAGIKYDIGINIDVFPVDGVPSDADKHRNHFNKIKKYRNILAVKTIKLSSNRSFFKNIVLFISKLLFSVIPYQKIVQKIEKEILKYKYEECEYAMSPCINSKASFRTKKEVFEAYSEIQFEKHNFSAVKEFDHYLTILFGEYMKLPPKEQQITHHSFKAFLK